MTFSNELTLRVPAGLGDLWWIQQKLLGVGIHWRVLVTGDEITDERSREWLELFPSTLSVKYVHISKRELRMFWKSSFWLSDTPDSQHYLLNQDLEHGIHIAAIDPPGVGHFELPYNEPHVSDYDVLYVSRGTLDMPPKVREKTGAWDVDQWVDFVTLYWEKFGKRKLMFLGCSFDLEVLQLIRDSLSGDVAWFIDKKPMEVVGLLKRCNRFIGYQSGLNMVAESMEVKQCMMYFNQHEDLMWSWPILLSDKYSPFLFKSSPEDVIKRWS